jgi:hypothetical protein
MVRRPLPLTFTSEISANICSPSKSSPRCENGLRGSIEIAKRENEIQRVEDRYYHDEIGKAVLFGESSEVE